MGKQQTALVLSNDSMAQKITIITFLSTAKMLFRRHILVFGN
jgi:hypothetical protein